MKRSSQKGISKSPKVPAKNILCLKVQIWKIKSKPVTENEFSNYKELSLTVKFGYSEKATKFEKIFHLKFDVTQ